MVMALTAMGCPKSTQREDEASRLTQGQASAEGRLGAWRAKHGADAALVADQGGLYVVSRLGERLEVVQDKPMSWCALDHRTQLLWFVREDGEQRSLWTWSLAKADASPVPVTSLDPESFEPIFFKYVDGEVWRRPLGHMFRLGVLMDMSAAQPKLGVDVGCEDDQSWYCYEGSSEEQTLVEELQQRHDALSKLSLQDAAGLKRAIEAGGALKARYATAPKAEKPPSHVKISQEHCLEEPEDCGKAQALSGTPYWIVLTSNDRGDFYYESWQLYDPRTSQFISVDPQAGIKRSPTPSEESSFAVSEISPTGRGYSEGTGLVDFERGQVLVEVNVCGWLAPGFQAPRVVRSEL